MYALVLLRGLLRADLLAEAESIVAKVEELKRRIAVLEVNISLAQPKLKQPECMRKDY
jgi:hypothetical protein